MNEKRDGVIVKWNEEKGYGFVRDTNTNKDIFFHRDEIIFLGRKIQPSIGERATFFVSNSNDKPKAKSVELLQHVSEVKRLFVLYSTMLLITPLISFCLFAHLNNWEYYGEYLPFVIYFSCSTYTYFLYDKDKKMAQNLDRRIPEASLHLGELCGGWYGGYFAQQWLRHKSSKKSYQISFWSIVGFHQILALAYIYHVIH